jgi:pimeloyl-ACP methyl ester carboxylesterase
VADIHVEPFTISVSDDALKDLKERLLRTRWPDQIDGIGWEQGTDRAYLESLVNYWRSDFDWRVQEAALNKFAQFRATIGDQQIHFVHERARSGNGLPLIITHGWPGSFAEMIKIIPMLTDPEAHGGAADDAFDVVAPSLPGYGFSASPRKTGMNPFAIAELWAELMAGLGYDRFAAQGGDWGASVTMCLGFLFPERVLGAHLNYIPNSFQPPRDPSRQDGQDLTEEERAFLAARAAWVEMEGAYGRLHATRPQSIAYALNDSPAGLAGWIIEKFRAWSDCEGDVERAFTKDELLTNISIYWFTQTIGSSMRLYWESRQRPLRFAPDERVRTPTAIAHFPKEIPMPPKSWVERVFDVWRWTKMPRGGHFAALEQPELLAQDIRAFFKSLRGAAASDTSRDIDQVENLPR